METMAHLVRGFNLIYRNFPELGALYCYVSLPVGGKRDHVSLWNFHLHQIIPVRSWSKMARTRSPDLASWDLHGSMTAWPTRPARCGPCGAAWCGWVWLGQPLYCILFKPDIFRFKHHFLGMLSSGTLNIKLRENFCTARKNCSLGIPTCTISQGELAMSQNPGALQ